MRIVNHYNGPYIIMRCIGGTHDGQWKEVSEYLKVGDNHRIAEVFPITNVPSNINEDTATINYYEYRIASFQFNKDESYRFLVPKDMSDKEAILYQFSK